MEDENIVKLNVGGQIFVTTAETLNNKGTYNMLAAMLKHGSKKIDGSIFIDRNPTVFRWILNYLRGSKVLPNQYQYISDDESIKIINPEFLLLREEAEFYALENLNLRLKHIICPSFRSNDHIKFNDKKFTICGITKDGFIVTRQGNRYNLPPSSNICQTTIEIGDVVMAYHQPSSRRKPGICMAIENKDYTIQFNNGIGQDLCKLSGIRF